MPWLTFVVSASTCAVNSATRSSNAFTAISCAILVSSTKSASASKSALPAAVAESVFSSACNASACSISSTILLSSKDTREVADITCDCSVLTRPDNSSICACRSTVSVAPTAKVKAQQNSINNAKQPIFFISISSKSYTLIHSIITPVFLPVNRNRARLSPRPILTF